MFIYFILQSVRHKNSPPRSLKNELPRCSPPYELLCAPLPFGWLRQVRYRVSDRVFHVAVAVGWYLFGRPLAEKSTSFSHRHSLVRVLFVWLAGYLLVPNHPYFPSSLLPGRTVVCGVVYIMRDFGSRHCVRFSNKTIYFQHRDRPPSVSVPSPPPCRRARTSSCPS